MILKKYFSYITSGNMIFPKFMSNDSNRVNITHRVNNFDKRILVWTGKYKSIGEVPSDVGQNVMERARNRMRIRIANYMMAATALACVVMVIMGKKAHERGESVGKMAEQWHEEYAKSTTK